MSEEIPVPIADLLDERMYRNKQIVMCVAGNLRDLYQVKRGNGKDGPYEFQNGTIVDDNGDEIKVSFSNNTQPKSAQGQDIIITSFETKQHGWQGIKIEDREYEGKQGWVQERQLKVTGTANIEYPGGLAGQGGGRDDYDRDRGNTRQQQRPSRGQPQQGRGGPSRPQRDDRQAEQPQTQKQQQPNKPVNALPHPALILEDMIQLHFDVSKLIHEKYGEAKPEYVATVFIEAAKQGLVLDYKGRAAKPVKKAYPPAPKDPTKWKEAIVPSGDAAGKTLEEIPDDYLKKLFTFFNDKNDDTAFAKCVYKAAEDRGLVRPTPTPADPDLDVAPDDIPF